MATSSPGGLQTNKNIETPVLAFRLFGNFLVSCSAAPPEKDDQPIDAVVEIFFYGPEKGIWRAFLKWTPGKLSPGKLGLAEPPPDGDNNLFTIQDPASKFEGDESRSFWIDCPTGSEGVKIVFHGAFLFEQFSSTSSMSPELRWPLVRKWQHNHTIFYSCLIIGQETNGLFRFSLQLPTPVPQTMTEVDGPGVFPFSVLFKPISSKLESFAQIDTLVGGHDKFVLEKHNDFETARLGQFGFSPCTSGRSCAFVGYDGNRYPSDKNGYGDVIRVSDFWPTGQNSSRIFLNSVLRQFGFAIQETADLALLESNEMAMSIRFPRTRKGPNSALIYRLSIKSPDVNKSGSAGDLRWANGNFSLSMFKEIGGWLNTESNVLNADVELKWHIAEEDLWNTKNWNPTVELRLHWTQTVTQDCGGADPSSAVGILGAGIREMRSAIAGLKTVDASQPQSFLFDLSCEQTGNVRFCLYSPPLKAVFDDGEKILWFPQNGERPSLVLSLANEDISLPAETTGKLKFKAPAPTCFYGKQGKFYVNLMHDSDFGTQAAISFASFKLDVRAQPIDDWNGRLGSLQFKTKEMGGSGWLRIPVVPESTTRQTDCSVSVLLHYDFPVMTIAPIGVDVERFERTGRPTPLLIPIDESQTTKAQFRFEVDELLQPLEDRLLVATISEELSDQHERKKSFVVISQEPFSILRFDQSSLTARADEGNTAVATYSSDRGIWEFKQTDKHYHYTFPPQVVGESMDKPGRLEIHDLAAALQPQDKLFEPFAAADPPCLKRRAVEFRLTPSAEIWIRPTDVERGYFMPEWESYEIFRQRGELGLGAPLAAFRGEFLYGLSVGIDVAKEDFIARQSRVAEIEALTGTVTGRARLESADKGVNTRWKALSRALARRPERLEIWANDPTSPVPFAPARFAAGVSFAFRGTALHRPPLKAWEDKLLPFDSPRCSPNGLEANAGAAPRYHPQGLSGGALWPVESANLLNQLAKRPEARPNGGAIESIALSPIGGDAVQKAEFLDGLVTILSETRNGFVERQKVEVLGRICVFWHRAKHVVVYERTVNPSSQFAPKNDPFHTRTRRPVLRKVNEYIELLDIDLPYPDTPQAAPRNAGFLKSVRFNSKIINVDSAWSRDVDDFGWEIPLWRRHSARERPQVYPMPHIAFVTAAEGEGEQAKTAQDCLDPDSIYFFADFSSGGDPKQWVSRLGLDYSNLPNASKLAGLADKQPSTDPAADGKSPEPRRKNVSRFLPGMRRFTWRLSATAQRTAINAGRSDTPVYVGVEAVSFMRATHAGQDSDHAMFNGLSNFFQATAGMDAVEVDSTPLSAILSTTGYWNADGGQGPDHASSFAKAVAKFREAVRSKTPDSTQIKAAKDALLSAYGPGC